MKLAYHFGHNDWFRNEYIIWPSPSLGVLLELLVKKKKKKKSCVSLQGLLAELVTCECILLVTIFAIISA